MADAEPLKTTPIELTWKDAFTLYTALNYMDRALGSDASEISRAHRSLLGERLRKIVEDNNG